MFAPSKRWRLFGLLTFAACVAASPGIASQSNRAGYVNVPGFGQVWVQVISPDGKEKAQIQADQNYCVSASRTPAGANQTPTGDLHIYVPCMGRLGHRIELSLGNGARVELAQIPSPAAGSASAYGAPSSMPGYAANGRTAPTAARPAGSPNPAYAQLLDRIVSEDSRSWAVNRYRAGSISSVTVSGSGADVTVHGSFQYASGQQNGWVEARLHNSQVSCVRYWDFPDQCRQVGAGLARQIEEQQRRQQAAWAALPLAERNRILAERRRQNAAEQEQSLGWGFAGAFLGTCPLGLDCR